MACKPSRGLRDVGESHPLRQGIVQRAQKALKKMKFPLKATLAVAFLSFEVQQGLVTLWEVHDMAVQVVRNHLQKQGFELMSWQVTLS